MLYERRKLFKMDNVGEMITHICSIMNGYSLSYFELQESEN